MTLFFFLTECLHSIGQQERSHLPFVISVYFV